MTAVCIAFAGLSRAVHRPIVGKSPPLDENSVAGQPL